MPAIFRRTPARLRDLDREMRAFLGMEAPEEDEIVAGLGLEREPAGSMPL